MCELTEWVAGILSYSDPSFQIFSGLAMFTVSRESVVVTYLDQVESTQDATQWLSPDVISRADCVEVLEAWRCFLRNLPASEVMEE